MLGRSLLRRIGRLGIRGRLVLLVLALGVPFLGYVVFSAAGQVAREREVAKERSLAMARMVAARLDDYVGDVNQLLVTLSYVVPTAPEVAAENDALLRRLGPNLPSHVNNIAVWDIAGNNVGTLDPAARAHPFSVADRQYFRAALEGKGLAVEAPMVSRTNGQRVAQFARAVTHEGRVVGVVSASLRLAELQALLDPKGALPPRSVVTVIDQRGVILGRSIDPDRWIGQSLATQKNIMDEIARGEGTARPTSWFDGITRLGGFTTARRAPWLVYVGVPADAALAALRRQLLENALLGTCALLFGLIGAALIGEGIARPLRRLAVDASILAQGDLDHRSSVTGGGEAGVLASGLNTMAQALRDRALALTQSEQRLRLIADNVPASIAYIDRDERYRFANASHREIFGNDPEELLGRTIREIRGEAVYAQIKPRLDEALGGLPVRYEYRHDGPKGPREMSMTYMPDYREGNVREVNGIYVMGLDVTAEKRAEQALARSEAQLRAIADNLPVLIAVVDRDERYRFCNSTHRDWLGVDPATLVGKSLAEVLGPAEYAEDKPYVDRVLAGETVSFERSAASGAVERHMAKTFVPLRDEAKRSVDGFYVLVQDLTVRKALEDKLGHMAQYDQLTGLPNRYLLHDRLAQACARSQREGIQLALLYLDLDGFKRINDTRGHAAGDAILRGFAQRAAATVRVSDTVARVGGDEFVILMEGFFSYRQLEAAARKIVDVIEVPFTFEGEALHVSSSIGVATFPPSKSWEELLQSADAAMYAAKSTGAGAVVFAPLQSLDRAKFAWTPPASRRQGTSS